MEINMIEKLPRETIGDILSSLPTIERLNAFIHAAPYIYQCFAASKQMILRQVLFNELGPVTRDAIFCEYQSGLKLYPDPDWEKLKRATAQYKYFLNEATIADLKSHAPHNIVINIIRRLRSLQRIVDCISAPILSEFRDLEKPAAQPLSPVERRRFLQALFRYNSLLRYDPTLTDFEPHEFRHWEHPGLNMFRSWELQQISDINCFLSRIWYALIDAEKCGPIPRDIGEATRTADRLTKEYCYDLEKLWAKVDCSTREDPEFLEHLNTQAMWRSQDNGILRVMTSCTWDYQDDPINAELPSDDIIQSHRLDTNDVSNPPYAWIDALDGNVWQRWGSLLLDALEESATWDIVTKNEKTLVEWRCYGFMFWDEERVKRLKETDRFGSLQSGWVLHAWDILH